MTSPRVQKGIPGLSKSALLGMGGFERCQGKTETAMDQPLRGNPKNQSQGV